MRNKHSIKVLSVGAILLLVFGLYVSKQDERERADARRTAEAVVRDCSTENDFEKCYERVVPELYPENNLATVFQVIREIRKLDSRYQFCHVLAHRLGEDAVLQDPKRWLEFVPLNPTDGMCSNGFIHGVLIGRFSSSTLTDEQLEVAIPDLSIACEPSATWSPSPLDQAMCYHSMGHLLTYITDASLRKAANLCLRVAKAGSKHDYTRVCVEGVFMQIYQPLEPEDFELVEKLPEKPTAQNYRRLCAAYILPDVVGACLREAWPLFRKPINEGVGGAAFCARQPDAQNTDACYDTIVSIIGRGSLSKPESALAACSALPEQRRANCYARVAFAIVEEDRGAVKSAIKFCSQSREYVQNCYGFLADRGSFVFKNERDRGAYCEELPKDYQQRCRGTSQ